MANVVTKEELERLIKRYSICQMSSYKDGEYRYLDNIIMHDAELAEKDGMIPRLIEIKDDFIKYFEEKREEERKQAEERERKISEIEGLKEIEDALADMANWQREFAKSFDYEGGVGVRPRPQYDFDAMYAKYPAAKAYLDAFELWQKHNYSLSAIGKRALEKIIENKENYKEAIEEMEKEVRKFTYRICWD